MVWRRGSEDGDEGGPANAVSEDDAAEFGERLRETSSLAFRVAYGVLRHRQDAEDVAQEALLRAYERRASLRERDAFRGWLVRITWRAALDRVRSNARRGRRELALVEPAGPGATGADDGVREARVWRAVDALPEELRLVVVLAAIEGHGTKEVAALVGAPEGTVKSRLHRARKELAETLEWMKE